MSTATTLGFLNKNSSERVIVGEWATPQMFLLLKLHLVKDRKFLSKLTTMLVHSECQSENMLVLSHWISLGLAEMNGLNASGM